MILNKVKEKFKANIKIQLLLKIIKSSMKRLLNQIKIK